MAASDVRIAVLADDSGPLCQLFGPDAANIVTGDGDDLPL